MSFSCKIVSAYYVKGDGSGLVYLQAIMDRRPARVPMGFYIGKEFLDKKGFVKSSHPNANEFNAEIHSAIAKANKLASVFRHKNKKLTPDLFKAEFINPSDELDLFKYMRKELDSRTDLAPGTRKHHHSVINKLEEFKKLIRFGDVNRDLIKEFKKWLSKKGNNDHTVSSKLKIVKQYLIEARKNGHDFEDPFKHLKIKNFKSKRNSLSETELQQVEKYYENTNCPRNHKRLLQYFIFSCYTGVRISDIGLITWDNIKDSCTMLEYIPQKTKRKNQTVYVPLLAHDHKYLPPFVNNKRPIFKTFCHQVANRYLKAIADKVDLRKSITYHTSRHTFGTLMAEGGHLPETQIMMGHDDIKTTMGYVHASKKALIEAKKKRFGKLDK